MVSRCAERAHQRLQAFNRLQVLVSESMMARVVKEVSRSPGDGVAAVQQHFGKVHEPVFRQLINRLRSSLNIKTKTSVRHLLLCLVMMSTVMQPAQKLKGGRLTSLLSRYEDAVGRD